MRDSAVLDRQLAKRPPELDPPRIARIVVLRVHDYHVRVPAARQEGGGVLLDEVYDRRQRDQKVSLFAEAREELSVSAHHARPVCFGECPVVELEVRVVLGVQDAAVVGVDDEFAAAQGVEGAFDEEVAEGFGVVGGYGEAGEGLGGGEDEGGEEVDGFAFEGVGQRVWRVLFGVDEFAVLDEDGVDVLEEQGEGLVGIGAEGGHLGGEGVEERVDVLRLVGEEQGADGPDAQGHFADDAEEAEVGSDCCEVLSVLLLGDVEQFAVALDELDAYDERGDLSSVGQGGVVGVRSYMMESCQHSVFNIITLSFILRLLVPLTAP